MSIDLTSNQAVENQHDLSSDNHGAIYNRDQLMLEGDGRRPSPESEGERRGVINHAPAHDLNACGDRAISRLIISIMIFKV